MCDLVNHTRFPKENHLPDWARRDNQVKKGDRVQYINIYIYIYMCVYQFKYLAFTWYISTIHDIMSKIYIRAIQLEWWKYTRNWVRKGEQLADVTGVLGRLHITFSQLQIKIVHFYYNVNVARYFYFFPGIKFYRISRNVLFKIINSGKWRL